MVFLILKSHRALHFRGRVDERTQRIARQRMVIAAGIYVIELAASRGTGARRRRP